MGTKPAFMLQCKLEVLFLQLLSMPVVVVVVTSPLPRDGGTTRKAIQVHAVNLIEFSKRKDGSPSRTSRE